jgi:hypothetical protein
MKCGKGKVEVGFFPLESQPRFSSEIPVLKEKEASLQYIFGK